MENRWMDIIKHLLNEIRELKEEVHLLKSMLHSNITILGNEDKED